MVAPSFLLAVSDAAGMFHPVLMEKEALISLQVFLLQAVENVAPLAWKVSLQPLLEGLAGVSGNHVKKISVGSAVSQGFLVTQSVERLLLPTAVEIAVSSAVEARVQHAAVASHGVL